jgi:hypothetical protein
MSTTADNSMYREPVEFQGEAAPAFKNGDIVFNLYGHEGRYVASTSGGHVVEPIYKGDFEPVYAEVQNWRDVFTTPPTAKLHAEVAQVEESLRSAQFAMDALRTEQRALEGEVAAARKRIAARPDLVDLDLWLQGKVTHIVSLEYYGLRIGTVEETLRMDDRDHQLRLLSLMADPKANRFWVGYAMYSDGSSNQTRCLLATSLEHARERAAEYVRQEVARNRGQNHGGLAAAAIKYGVEISEELRKEAADMEAKAALHTLQSTRRELERAQASFAIAEARAKALGAES